MMNKLNSNMLDSNANEKPFDAIEVEDMTTSTAASTMDSFNAPIEQDGVANTPAEKKTMSSFRNGTPGASSSGLPPKTPSTSTRCSARPLYSKRNRNEEAEKFSSDR